MSKAVRNILKERAKEYGEFTANVKCIAGLNEVILTKNPHLTLEELARFNFLFLKINRLATYPQHKDSWLDLAGYATLCYEELPLPDDFGVEDESI